MAIAYIVGHILRPGLSRKRIQYLSREARTASLWLVSVKKGGGNGNIEKSIEGEVASVVMIG